MDREKVLNLAKLARIKISEAEADSLSHEFEAILQYVSEVKSVSGADQSSTPESFPNRNVLREDSEGHDSGIYTKQILAEAPATEGGYIKVKKILSWLISPLFL